VATPTPTVTPTQPSHLFQRHPDPHSHPDTATHPDSTLTLAVPRPHTPADQAAAPDTHAGSHLAVQTGPNCIHNPLKRISYPLWWLFKRATIVGYPASALSQRPRRIVTRSDFSAGQAIAIPTRRSGQERQYQVEPQPRAVYIAGVWTFYLEMGRANRSQISSTIDMNVENRVWYFFRFQPN